MPLTRERTLEALDESVTRFASLIAQADGAEPVPACPGWTTHDLISHLGGVHRWAAAIVLSGERIPTGPTPLITGDLAEWYSGCATALKAALEAVDPDERTPNPSRIGETSAYWARRQLHETTIHTVDLQQALGLSVNLDGEVAADGIAEVLGVYFPRMTAVGTRPHVEKRIRLDSTDRYDSWISAPGSDPQGPPVLIHGNSDAETSIRGTTSELYLALWNRIPHDVLTYDSPEALALMTGPKTT